MVKDAFPLIVPASLAKAELLNIKLLLTVILTALIVDALITKPARAELPPIASEKITPAEPVLIVKLTVGIELKVKLLPSE